MTGRQGNGQHGGARTPARPAAVSNPQSGNRTDGGPADKQPLRVPTGGAYGEAGALTEQQQGAPMAAGGPGPGQAPPGLPTDGAPQPDLFRPSERPGERMPQPVPQQEPLPAEMILRQLAAAYPSPWIMRMLRSYAKSQ